MKVAIVHDDLVQWGGAERVLEGLAEIYPDAPFFTSVYDQDNKELYKRYGDKKIITSFLQKIPGWKNIYKQLLPLYPIAFEQFNFDQFDLVISHTTRFAKSIITKPHTKHVCYCHTPPRFLWHFSGNKNYGFAEGLMSKLRIYDQVSARRADYFIAGSKNAQNKIKKIYRKDCPIVYPFIDLQRFKNIESFDGGYFLVISRLNKYKKIDLAAKACFKLGLPLKIVGDGPELFGLHSILNQYQNINIEFLGHLQDALVTEVIAGCKGLIIPGEEDFGLVSLEAQALGKPVIAYHKGGSLETVIDGKTGIFFDQQSVEALTLAIVKLAKSEIEASACLRNAATFSKEKFKSDFMQVLANLGYTI